LGYRKDYHDLVEEKDKRVQMNIKEEVKMLLGA
jgi:hypothetical protein